MSRKRRRFAEEEEVCVLVQSDFRVLRLVAFPQNQQLWTLVCDVKEMVKI